MYRVIQILTDSKLVNYFTVFNVILCTSITIQIFDTF